MNVNESQKKSVLSKRLFNGPNCVSYILPQNTALHRSHLSRLGVVWVGSRGKAVAFSGSEGRFEEQPQLCIGCSGSYYAVGIEHLSFTITPFI